ncbi:YceI family protein [Neorhizobium sp. CSC1952]|uniref:Polyisoprenoid-binding protein YceI n=1 Tax=Xaviernesmea oryzae TaxID=464029 RepID=A0A1X7F5M3_9HYPH|nr:MULTISPECIES: YceI family protein [Rhizobium/Agrobacterium group]WJR67907.1 YceI family protein [Rhizobium sp. CSC1952]SMF45852.1 Polyisoprenoid-binding protein YceI [Xaviernesmea oryzae]
MTHKTTLIAALLVAASFPETSRSDIEVPSLSEVAGRYAITPGSRIAFTVDQVGGGGIKGKFGKFSGTFNLKAGDLPHSMVNFELKPGSVSTGQARIDAFLRSGAVFDTDHFDTISFRSNRVEQTGPDSARITGTLTAKGRSMSESFDVKLTGWSGRKIAFNVSGRIFRSRYAMDVGTPIYSNVVQFDMMIEGLRS